MVPVIRTAPLRILYELLTPLLRAGMKNTWLQSFSKTDSASTGRPRYEGCTANAVYRRGDVSAAGLGRFGERGTELAPDSEPSSRGESQLAGPAGTTPPNGIRRAGTKDFLASG